jgi:hypothetical protein
MTAQMSKYPSANLSICIIEAINDWSDTFAGGLTDVETVIEGLAFVISGVCASPHISEDQCTARVIAFQQSYAKCLPIVLSMAAQKTEAALN